MMMPEAIRFGLGVACLICGTPGAAIFVIGGICAGGDGEWWNAVWRSIVGLSFIALAAAGMWWGVATLPQ